jgi:putative salt-induced outer membrane protein YdiY
MAGVARSCASWGCSVVFVFAIVVAAERPGQAQTPPAAPAEPSKAWTTTASLGLTVTSGNTETSTFNAGFDVKFDPKTNNLFKAEGLLLRGKTSGELSTSRFGFILRDEHRVSQRVFVFGQNQYLKDRFKEIDYLVAPTAGVGITLVSTEATRFNIDAGAGGVWEKNTLLFK